jgi:hypothetical protein
MHIELSSFVALFHCGTYYCGSVASVCFVTAVKIRNAVARFISLLIQVGRRQPGQMQAAFFQLVSQNAYTRSLIGNLFEPLVHTTYTDEWSSIMRLLTKFPQDIHICHTPANNHHRR